MNIEHPFGQFKFCPKCGSSHFVVHNEKSKECQDCGFVYYFNPSAAVVAVILNDKNEVLTCRRAKEPAKGTLDLPGGFCDCYETSEESVAREVLEETGLKVCSTHYLFSLPNLYLYCGFLVHTVDNFFLCRVEHCEEAYAMDDAIELEWQSWDDLKADDFGLLSIRNGVIKLLDVPELLHQDKA